MRDGGQICAVHLSLDPRVVIFIYLFRLGLVAVQGFSLVVVSMGHSLVVG